MSPGKRSPARSWAATGCFRGLLAPMPRCGCPGGQLRCRSCQHGAGAVGQDGLDETGQTVWPTTAIAHAPTMCRSCNDHTTGHRDGKGRALSEVSTLTTDWWSCTGFALRKSQPRAG